MYLMAAYLFQEKDLAAIIAEIRCSLFLLYANQLLSGSGAYVPGLAGRAFTDPAVPFF